MGVVPARYVEPVRDVADVADDGDMGALRPPRRLEDMSATWIACSLGALTSPLDINGVFEPGAQSARDCGQRGRGPSGRPSVDSAVGISRRSWLDPTYSITPLRRLYGEPLLTGPTAERDRVGPWGKQSGTAKVRRTCAIAPLSLDPPSCGVGSVRA